MKTTRNHPSRDRRWVMFSDGCLHGIRHSEVVVRGNRPNRCVARSSVSVFTLSRTFCACLALAGLLFVVLFLAACAMPRAQRGGAATSHISRPGHTNSVTLQQSDNPKEPSTQTVQSDQTMEYVLPRGTALDVGSRPAVSSDSGQLDRSSGSSVLQQAIPVRVVTRDRVETRIGGAQKDTAREWATKAANMQPVMWAGIAMMTIVAGVLIYFGWWTKAALAAGVGLGMIIAANTLPGHGAIILIGGLVTFGLAALLVLYAYCKGQLDRNQNGIPDFLERERDVPF
jgi:hypothetical protein